MKGEINFSIQVFVLLTSLFSLSFHCAYVLGWRCAYVLCKRLAASYCPVKDACTGRGLLVNGERRSRSYLLFVNGYSLVLRAALFSVRAFARLKLRLSNRDSAKAGFFFPSVVPIC